MSRKLGFDSHCHLGEELVVKTPPGVCQAVPQRRRVPMDGSSRDSVGHPIREVGPGMGLWDFIYVIAP